MKTIWHIVKKDFRHCRWMLLALVAIWLAKAAFMYEFFYRPAKVSPRFDYIDYTFNNWPHIPVVLNGTSFFKILSYKLDPSTFVFMCVLFGCFIDLILLVGIILKVIKEDSAINERTFWRTRPISRGQMLAAKAFFIGLVAFPLPVALQAGITHLFIGLDYVYPAPPSIYGIWLGAILDVWLIQASWTAMAVFVATLWHNRIIGVGTVLLSIMAAFFITISYQHEPLRDGVIWNVGLIFLLYCTGFAGAVLIGAAMYLKSDRAFGFSLYGAMLTIFYLLLIFR